MVKECGIVEIYLPCEMNNVHYVFIILEIFDKFILVRRMNIMMYLVITVNLLWE